MSTDADESDDEEDDQDNYSHNSFIDDRINPTAVGTQSETSRIDMIAIYRFLANYVSFVCSIISSMHGVLQACEFKFTLRVLLLASYGG